MKNVITFIFCLLASIVIHSWGGFSKTNNKTIVHETFEARDNEKIVLIEDVFAYLDNDNSDNNESWSKMAIQN